ncbi:pyridoxamine 5'-phosphate oxidase family protein [Pseudosulfitobacter pseudonitzschiae]|uniref:pyridoxamine 5'-phosphate oxidase family protein n=1 Tax=Pseudosulfitobacter pseudonitzschiae TaxID=1402135 RepID=UPI001AF4B172|nr:pyridoxamine 5'-phosphate oxidase family protein [Pseudosulfitobacter pseudonitzschiae]MBM1814318.1 pyridoxamine 5'-phosphate oxidase family protein [Pseudosulfitobacter pseudonitzschiae]MBM1831311.1 pyridoxamine 5'-phosphate oxidase family protein [Pseudosulfitobacter pseudonitzschiae]MBM1836178.1 pyridoxamine 5'-phosphate oxidase family protein [Pseudosulfitobacter pseudonitzschiae]MBM1841024.1 pyridoxamine 5'-phosphate oxidase family protein [Pseudosulfitobacter pseudonitzschiae]MBM18458
MKDHTPQSELKETFWDRIGDINAGMLATPSDRARPMSHTLHDDDRTALWFITAHGTDIADAAKKGSAATYLVACQHNKLYATVEGALDVVTDPKTLDDLWSPVADAWFEGGQEDPDVCLVRMKLSKAEVWATDGGAKFLFEIAKANLTDAKPDMGDHGVVTF